METINNFEIVYRDEQTENKAAFLRWLLMTPVVRRDRLLRRAVFDYLKKVLDLARRIQEITGTMFSMAVLLINRILHPVKGSAQNAQILSKAVESNEKAITDRVKDLKKRDEYIFRLLGVHDKRLYLDPDIRAKYEEVTDWIRDNKTLNGAQKKDLLNSLSLSRSGHFIIGGLEREIITKEEFEKYTAFAKERGEKIWHRELKSMVLIKVNDLYETFIRGEVVTRKREEEAAFAKKYAELTAEFRQDAIDTAGELKAAQDAVAKFSKDPEDGEELKAARDHYQKILQDVKEKMESYRTLMADYEKTIAGKIKLLHEAEKDPETGKDGIKALETEIKTCKKDYELLSLKVAICLQLLNTDSFDAFIREQNSCIKKELAGFAQPSGDTKIESAAEHTLIDERLKKYSLTPGSETEINGKAQQKEILGLIAEMAKENREELNSLKVRLIVKDGVIKKDDDYCILCLPLMGPDDLISDTGKSLNGRVIAIPREGIVKESATGAAIMDIPLNASFCFVDENGQFLKERLSAPDLFIHGNLTPASISMSDEKTYYIDGERAQIMEQDGIRYGLAGKRAVVIQDFSDREHVEIPDEIRGLDGKLYPVDEIKEGAFRGSLRLTRLKLPAGLREIAPYAFENCTRLSAIDYEKGNRSAGLKVGEGAFDGCCSVTSISPDLYESMDHSVMRDEAPKTEPVYERFVEPEVRPKEQEQTVKPDKAAPLNISIAPDIEL